MLVRELIEQLQALDPELTILMQKDDEGNGYRRANGADTDCYVHESQSDSYDFDDVYREDDLDPEEDIAEFKQFVVLY